MEFQVLSVMLLLVGVATAGSGPYLPSGWRPKGPAFLLPTEIKETSPTPLEDVALQETSGSNFLREYGPPEFKLTEVSQDLTVQALPDEATAQPFVVIKAKYSEDEEQVVKDTEETLLNEDEVSVTTESQASIEETTIVPQGTGAQGRSLEINIEIQNDAETATDIIEKEEKVTEVLTEVVEKGETVEDKEELATEKNVNALTDEIAEVKEIKEGLDDNATVEVETEVTTEETLKTTAETTEKLIEGTEQKTLDVKDNENADSNIVTKVDEKEEIELKSVDGNVKNIEETLINLENEAKAEKVEVIKEVTEIKTVADSSRSAVPEGFLEYGPPGFTEYGPPKVSELLESPASNEVRRRRFSPKLKVYQRRKH